jgi:hypothetical protein
MVRNYLIERNWCLFECHLTRWLSQGACRVLLYRKGDNVG